MNVAYIKKSTLCCTCEWGDVIASWVIAMVCVCKCIVLHIWMSRTWMSHIWMQHIWMLHTRFVNQTIKPLKLWTPNTTAQKTYYVFPFDYHQTAYCERTCTIRDFLNIHTWLRAHVLPVARSGCEREQDMSVCGLLRIVCVARHVRVCGKTCALHTRFVTEDMSVCGLYM